MNMKKFMLLSAAACVALAFTGCKSSESAYKKAYEKAKAQENAGYNISQNTPSETQYGNNEPQVQVVTPAVVTPVTETPVVDNTDNVAVRTENISVVSGEGLKAYSVVPMQKDSSNASRTVATMPSWVSILRKTCTG